MVMEIKVNDIVMVIGKKSIPDDFMGQYGRVKALNSHKVNVELYASIGGKGSLSHTAYPEDLKVVGKTI
jgi:hypothetical protein